MVVEHWEEKRYLLSGTKDGIHQSASIQMTNREKTDCYSRMIDCCMAVAEALEGASVLDHVPDHPNQQRRLSVYLLFGKFVGKSPVST
jgi:hypothetical protein